MAFGGELRFQARLHPRLGWLLVQLQVGQGAEARLFAMVISTLTPTSGLSVTTRNVLLPTGHLITLPQRPDRYLLRNLQIEGQQLPDLEVAVSALAGRAGVDGLLGLNFFQRFIDVRLHVPSLEFTLVDP